MPRTFELQQRVALNGDPIRIGRVTFYSANPTTYGVTFEDGTYSEHRAGSLTAVADAEPKPLGVGDRAEFDSWTPHHRYSGSWERKNATGLIVAINCDEAVVLRDEPTTRECGSGKTRTFHHALVPVGRLRREKPKPLDHGDVVRHVDQKVQDCAGTIVAIDAGFAWVKWNDYTAEVVSLAKLVRA